MPHWRVSAGLSFVGKPVVLDLSALDLSRPAITHLVNNLEERQHPRAR